jgi:hypothetical protein
MELLKILGGLAVIAALVVAYGLEYRGADAAADAAPAPVKVERGFASGDTSARFLSATTQ